MSELENIIEAAWDDCDAISVDTKGEIREAVELTIEKLDKGTTRVASRGKNGDWTVHQWVKKAVLLGFKLNKTRIMPNIHVPVGGIGTRWDKVPSKFEDWEASDFKAAGFRAVPGSLVRRGAYIGPDCVLMPSFVNIGAYVGTGTMVDTWASVGSCAQIGAHCHISAGTGIGGVLEPLQASPTVIEDTCFIGARSEVVEGVIVREGSVLAMGVFISQSTRIIDRASGAITFGEVPPYSVVVPGTLPDPKGGPSLACVVIVKTVDAKTRSKTSVNNLLRG
ncbi:MAG: 2,3,4,5-tetrahydropyridine-2,6-dicarboxylate N-succinyltransferase [Robiginitomaculum sp.]